MKPGFALSLSLEGIALLHRAADGWRVVGDVSLDAPDLTNTLEDLRQRALEIDPRGPVCKLIIPNDQIRYLNVPATASDDDENREMAVTALATATPYTLDELAFDLNLGANHTQVAAVARATLAEAEQFATEHGFEPVSFVAIPDGTEFDGEPNFGPASRVADEEPVERDDAPVSVIGMAIEPAPPPEPSAVEDDHSDPDISDRPAEVPPEPAQFTSRRSKADEPSTAPPLAGATRNAPDMQPVKPVEPTPSVASIPETESALPEPVPTEPEPVPTEPEPVSTEPVPVPANPEPVPTEPVPLSTENDTATAEEDKPETTATTPDADTPPDTIRKPVIIRPAKSVESATSDSAPPASQPDPEPMDEAARLTVFGARERSAVGGKPRHLGLILMAALLLFLAGVAAWATFFLEDGLAGLFDRSPAVTEQAAVPTAPTPGVQSSAPTSPATDGPTADGDVETARIEPEAASPGDTAPETTTEADSATPEPAGAADPQALQQDLDRYAATGIWQRAPAIPETPEIVDLNNLYEVSIDRTDLAQDAVALPSLSELDTDLPLDSVTAPAAAGTTFALGADGLVIPSPEGTLTPEGIRVFQGKPPVVPPPTPTRFEAEPDLDAGRDRLAGLRPKPRPSDLVEQTERTQLGGLTRAELGQVRPKTRPRTQKQEAERDETPTAQAVVVSKTPKARPRNFSAKVEKARKQTAGPSAQVAAVTVAPRTVKPKIPSSASVARRATLDNAINLRRINLIGVYGTPANRRALVRLPSGRYKKVKVGDRVDGGKIVAIGDSELRYQKNGRNVTLKMPRG
ncbi:hypothetical protein [Sedimentitalea todarodis]|uniref:Type IV pilus biogenesis n=1 Tax=Sedimentitalea todarodis TaxID=1631240 RepID=A0ABU3V977_9RHOB|nr:hypothetical protein [Sedimentitalea todarodis]MDU9002722.1 hypothetical protein [Sedimentitalea todarodis]